MDTQPKTIQNQETNVRLLPFAGKAAALATPSLRAGSEFPDLRDVKVFVLTPDGELAEVEDIEFDAENQSVVISL